MPSLLTSRSTPPMWPTCPDVEVVDISGDMPSPRACRACGAFLLPDLRWCPQCYEPVTEFAARLPLHHGDFVGSPIPTGGHIPHWSRWEKSATTFGPVGRVIATTLLFATLFPAIASGGFMYLLCCRYDASGGSSARPRGHRRRRCRALELRQCYLDALGEVAGASSRPR
jgi:hypothetical protein